MAAQERMQLRQLHTRHDIDTAGNTGYEVRVSQETEDPDWDAFVAETLGYHAQTSLWAQVKAVLGWHAVRVVVTRRERIVAGTQVLMRSLPFGGTIGYVPRGPLLALDDSMLVKLVIDQLHQVAKAHRIQYLAVQPPSNSNGVVQQLSDCGFRPSSRRVLPTATVLVDLTREPEEILAQMRAKTRYNIRLGQRKGITVREGTERDLHIFYRLLVATGQRQKFSSNPEEYFSEMWHILAPQGYAKLFLAEYEGEAVSALLAVPFGDTVTYKRGAWSGRHGSLHPNEVIHWRAIMWAKAQGYSYYDLEGIDPKVAKAIMHGEPLPDSPTQTVTSYKLGFGGQIILFPETYYYIYNPLLRWAYHTVVSKIEKWPVVSKIEHAMRGMHFSRIISKLKVSK